MFGILLGLYLLSALWWLTLFFRYRERLVCGVAPVEVM